MKRTNIIYWIFTFLFSALMVLSAIPDAMASAEAVAFMTKLGYPLYFTVFIGIAKILGVIGILVPGFPRIREWAYAGLFFDLIGAVYSLISVGEPFSSWSFLLLTIALGIGSYFFYHKRLRDGGNPEFTAPTA